MKSFLLMLLLSPLAVAQTSQSTLKASAPSAVEEDTLEDDYMVELDGAESSPEPEAAPAPKRLPAQAAPGPAAPLPEPEDILAVDLGPEEEHKPTGVVQSSPNTRPQGGTVKVPHPGAAQGLIRIRKDGSYQYRVPLRPKSQAMSVRLGVMSPPVTENSQGITFKSMYGSSDLFALQVDYEWTPFRGFGALGVQLGTGFSTSRASGRFADGREAQEAYDIYIVPLSAFAVYRFEYVRRQWVVPFVNAGGTYYGVVEKRDDDKPAKFAGSPAVGGGGGVHLSISRLDSESAFTLDREYGIADMWLTLEARAMQGLNQDLDFTNQTISAGVTVDF